jgi:hypothetical protein
MQSVFGFIPWYTGSLDIPEDGNLTRQTAVLRPLPLSLFFWLHFNSLVGAYLDNLCFVVILLCYEIKFFYALTYQQVCTRG